EEDTLVMPEQSKILYDKLKATGVPATLIMVKHAGHGFKPVGGQPVPSVPDLMRMIADFFDRTLK
ncbi:MAG: alpha/beta hydrolase family protein, partial [bacterium]